MDQNGHKICQHLSDTPKATQIGIFGLKIYHLATLPFPQSINNCHFLEKFFNHLPKYYKFPSVSFLSLSHYLCLSLSNYLAICLFLII
jgi:hypothetical protein